MPITTKQARELAAQYPVGQRMREFAAGKPVSYEGFLAELDMVSSEYSFEAFDDVRALQEWAEVTEDPVWTDA
jgi:hypothetical protein